MSSRIDEMITEYGVYDTREIVNNFRGYVGYTFAELEKKFINIEEYIISKDEIKDYCKSKFFSEKAINQRLNDYDCFCKKLFIYRDKGIMILNLMGNLSDVFFKNEELDNLLSDLAIYYKNCVVCGDSVIRLIRPLRRIILEIDKCIGEINNFSTYDRVNFDRFALSLGDELYPSESIIRNGNDPTSISVRRRKKCY